MQTIHSNDLTKFQLFISQLLQVLPGNKMDTITFRLENLEKWDTIFQSGKSYEILIRLEKLGNFIQMLENLGNFDTGTKK